MRKNNKKHLLLKSVYIKINIEKINGRIDPHHINKVIMQAH